MATIRLTKEFKFETAHALDNYDGLCKHIHGHSYKLFITVAGTPCSDTNNPKLGMVMDFGELKRIVNHGIVDPLDHALLLRDTPVNQAIANSQDTKFHKTTLVPYQPTCENMITAMVEMLQRELPQNVTLKEVTLYETASSKASWKVEDQL